MSPPEEFLRALRRRDGWRADGATDAWRLVDGAGDGQAFDGLCIDDFAGRWLVQTSRPGQKPPQWLRALGQSADSGSGCSHGTLLPCSALGVLSQPDRTRQQSAVATTGKEAAPRSIYWKPLDARDQRPPVLWAGAPVTAPFTVYENGLAYRVDFAAGYSQGIFLDQRDNRLALRRRMQPGGTLLNCFAYTGAFSVAAAAAGARTVSVDLSRRSLDWAKENFALNGLAADGDGGHEFLAGDVFDWLGRFARRGRRFDGIVFDPPTFSRNREGKIFRVERDFGALVRLAVPLLAPGGWLLCSSNARGLTAAGFRRLILSGLPAAGAGWRTEPAPMPPDFTGEPYLQALWVRPADRAAGRQTGEGDFL